MSAPYNLEAVDHLDPFLNAFEVGAGDVNWIEEVTFIASKGRPVILSTDAVTLEDVTCATDVLADADVPILLMQCNTNYKGTIENIHDVNLAVLTEYQRLSPPVTLALSDHTPGRGTLLGAIAF